jgi:hypothetical protein
MIESQLVEGRQDYVPGQPSVYGQSITDACLSLEQTEPLFEQFAPAELTAALKAQLEGLAAVASDTHRNTITGDACRSAIAPKIRGETNAASAVEAKAYGLIACKPCASRTRLRGTIHMPSAAP